MQKCSFCQTTYREIMQTGFVGCEHCYSEIDDLKLAIRELYGDKKHKGKKVIKDGSL